MRPRNEFHAPSPRNTLFGFIELTLWHGQKAVVCVESIQYVCEHTAGKNVDGTRVGVGGDALYVRDDFARVMSAMTVEQAARFKAP